VRLLGLGLGPRVVGRLGSGVWVMASFQIFALTARECPRWEEKLSGRGKSPRNMSEGEMSRGGVLISSSVWSTADYVTELPNQA